MCACARTESWNISHRMNCDVQSSSAIWQEVVNKKRTWSWKAVDIARYRNWIPHVQER